MELTDHTLAPLRAELQRLGYVVVPHGTELCIRLPLLCSVRIGNKNGQLRVRSKFGPLGRTAALLASSVVATAAVAVSAFTAGAPLTILVAFFGVLVLAHDACRFVLTEGCLTRLQQLVVERPALEAGGQPLLGHQLSAVSTRQSVAEIPTAERRERTAEHR